MIDVTTYWMLPRSDREAIEAWLRWALIEPDSMRCTEIEMIDEWGNWRVRHVAADNDGQMMIDGDDLIYSDATITVMNGAHRRVPEVLLALGPGPEPPPDPLIFRRHSVQSTS
jgi:hypothetical protein